MEKFIQAVMSANDILYHDYVLYIVLGTGILFTFWTKFCQYRALTHGVAVIRGKYDRKDDPGAINHFQALSAALSATVGLGNIGGVALAIALGGPGAVFWMWMVGIFGMALKATEVMQSMMYRNTKDPKNPHGGPMWVAKVGLKKMNPKLAKLGSFIGGVFCVTLLISTITGGNMFQAWNVAEITHSYFPTVPKIFSGIVMTLITGMVIIGGIHRIGSVTGRLVPFMCGLYLIAAMYVLFSNVGQIPEMLRLIFNCAFNPAESKGAFLGGTAGYSFLWGMKRALFSSEAGQGSAPIAHSAAKTDEPIREGVVAGLEPFVDTLVVCTLTTLVILLTGAWNRGPEAVFEKTPSLINATQVIVRDGDTERTLLGTVVEKTDQYIDFLNGNPGVGEAFLRRWPLSSVKSELKSQTYWIPETEEIPTKDRESARITGPWASNNTIFMVAKKQIVDSDTGKNLYRVYGIITPVGESLRVAWKPFESQEKNPPEMSGPEVFNDFVGAALTGHAFDRVTPGLGMWLVTICCWLFAVSTLISWSYYGEQGMIYLLGPKSVLPYKVIYCALILISTAGLIKTDIELDAITAMGTGVMLWANIPIMLIFGRETMKAYADYMHRLDTGKMKSHKYPNFVDVIEGQD
ncbi:MAG: amino acid carrier protein [Proteobacteria bacterium]|nr:amino acid carrier protein [Pseudomonadota bacterium]